MNNIISQAILERRLLELRYSGYCRVVEPHAYGLSAEGDELLRCFQVSGGSESGESVGWKLLKVREVFSLCLQAHRFNTRANYRRGDKAISHIFEQF
jgi:hypothetical protein